MRKIGFTCGAFDLFHAGHTTMLSDCRDRCDYLIIGLHTDPSSERKHKNKPIQSMYERYLQLSGCKYVDQIVPYDTENDLRNLLATLDINIRFIGMDHVRGPITAEDVCKLRNIEICFNERYHNFSSSELRNRIGQEKSSIL
jgi:glycerol-3-phosphate cytidylyltransferase